MSTRLISERTAILIYCLLIILGAVIILLPSIALTRLGSTYGGNAEAASAYFSLITIGIFSIVVGFATIWKRESVISMQTRKNARLVGALDGGGGALALSSTQNLFHYLFTSDYFSLEFFIGEAFIGAFLVALAFFQSPEAVAHFFARNPSIHLACVD